MSEQVHTSPDLAEQIRRAILDEMPYYVTRDERRMHAQFAADEVLDVLREAGLIEDDA